MLKLLLRVIAGALGGALAGAAALVLVVSLRPQLALEMDRDLGNVMRSYYEVERSGDLTYGWTRGDARLALPGLDRHRPWACTIRLRGARENPADLPVMTVVVDGTIIAKSQSSNDWQDLSFIVPARPQAAGTIIVLNSSTTFHPGPDDQRTLGVMVDRWSCAPEGAGIVRPPQRALVAAATGGAVFGAGFAALGLAPVSLVASICLLALLQAVPLGTGFAAFSTYMARVPSLAIWIVSPIVALGLLLTWLTGQRLSSAARFVLGVSAAAMYLKLLALLHPSKLIIDAVFQAHRFDGVLAGNYFFTQPMPSGVQFPYAIGLYLFAAPWADLTRDHVALLRIVVVVMEVLSGGLLYALVVRNWNDEGRAGTVQFMGAAAVVCFHLVPLPYVVVGNANLPNAFGQSVALIALTAAATLRLDGKAFLQWIGLFVVTSVALLSHVSTFAMLGATMGVLAILYWWRGGPTLRPAAYAVFVIVLLAAVFSVATYYGNRQFIEVYRGLGRVSAVPTPGASAGGTAGAPSTTSEPSAPAAPPVSSPFSKRLSMTMSEVTRAIGWPVLVLAAIGAWARRSSEGDRLTLLVVAWGLAASVLIAIVTMMPVNGPFERYAAEFIGRVALAAYPAAAILAARGLVRGWQAGTLPRVAVGAVAGAGMIIGVNGWLEWLR